MVFIDNAKLLIFVTKDFRFYLFIFYIFIILFYFILEYFVEFTVSQGTDKYF